MLLQQPGQRASNGSSTKISVCITGLMVAGISKAAAMATIKLGKSRCKFIAKNSKTMVCQKLNQIVINFTQEICGRMPGPHQVPRVSGWGTPGGYKSIELNHNHVVLKVGSIFSECSTWACVWGTYMFKGKILLIVVTVCHVVQKGV